jgi:MinD superfamily P-loop ATPase
VNGALDNVSTLIYISTVLDEAEEEDVLMRVMGRVQEEDVELCERCGKVCDSACRAGGACQERSATLLRHGRVV